MSQPRTPLDRNLGLELVLGEGHDLARVLTMRDLCRGENVFLAATGVTDGEMLRGVRYSPHSATTESLVMRATSGTIRWITSKHDFDRLRSVAGNRYEGHPSAEGPRP